MLGMALVGCASRSFVVPSLRTHSSLQTRQSAAANGIVLAGLDGYAFRDPAPYGIAPDGMTSDLLIPAGSHTLVVEISPSFSPGNYEARSPCTITFTAAPGRAYRINGEFSPRLREGTADADALILRREADGRRILSDQAWTAWLEEGADGASARRVADCVVRAGQ
jgi:hypothetical protein